MAKKSSGRFMRFLWRLMIKLTVLAVIGMFALPYVLKNPDMYRNFSVEKVLAYDYAGKVKGFFASFGESDQTTAPHANYQQRDSNIHIELTDKAQFQSGDVKIYRWQDENGKWHYSDAPDAAAKNEIMHVNINANVIQSVKVPADENKTITLAGGEAPSNSSSKELLDEVMNDDGLSLTTVPIDAVPELINETKNIQKIMDNRDKQLQSF